MMTDVDIITREASARVGWREVVFAAATQRRTAVRTPPPPGPGRISERPVAARVEITAENAALQTASWLEQAGTDTQALALCVEQLAGDLGALGATALAPDAGTTGGVTSIRSLRSAAEGLAAILEARRRPFVDTQLAKLGLSAASRGLRLHIGSGEAMLPGWINIDAAPSDLRMDLRWGLPFSDRSVDFVFMCHVLEHFYYPDDALRVLRDLRRVLSDQGCLRIVVPDIEQCIRAYAEDNAAFFGARRRTWTWWPRARTRLEDFLAYAGANTSPAGFMDTHKFGYDFETLSLLLKRAGFRHIERSTFMQSREPELRIDNMSAVAGAQYGDRYYSLFIDASR